MTAVDSTAATFPQRSRLWLLVIFVAASSWLIGHNLVLIAWTALEAGSTALVGQVFLAATVANLMGYPVIGVLVDTVAPQRLVAIGVTMRVTAVGALAAALAGGVDMASVLMCVAALNAWAIALIGGPMDRQFQLLVAASARVRTALRLGLARQVSLAGGSALSGLLIAELGAAWTAVSGALTTLVVGGLALVIVHGAPRPDGESTSPLRKWRDGLTAIVRRRRLLVAILLFSACFSAAQLTNLILPHYVSNVLGAGSATYGSIEAIWSASAVAALAVAGLVGAPDVVRLNLDRVAIAALGLGMWLASRNIDLSAAFVLFGAIGAAFALARSALDGVILTESEPTVIGRVRAATALATSAVGALIFASPALFGDDALVVAYGVWGATLTAGAVLSAIFSMRR